MSQLSQRRIFNERRFPTNISMMTDSALTTSVAQKCDEPGFICKICTKKRNTLLLRGLHNRRKEETEVNLIYEGQSQQSFTVL